MKRILTLIIILAFFLPLLFCSSDETSPVNPENTIYTFVYSAKNSAGDIELFVNTVNPLSNELGSAKAITTGYKDFKPSVSRNGNKIVFFRLVSGDINNPITIKSKICIVNFDGSGYKELTDANYANVNPTFTRDGTDRVIFNRGDSSSGRWSAHIIDSNGTIGSDESLTDLTKSEAIFTCLKDGRMIAYYSNGLALITPNPGHTGIYTHLTNLETTRFWSHFSLSPDETRIVTEEAFGSSGWNDFSVSIADINFTNNTISNVKSIVEPSPLYWDGYPRWSHDNKYVMFHSGKTGQYRLYLYNSAIEAVTELNLPKDKIYLYPCFKYSPV